MAEYYPLLERAVAGLQDATPASRRAIYDRARNALLGQLRAMQPPVPEEDIQRESVALDEAITRLEERFSKDRARPAPRPPAGVRPVVPPAQQAAPPGLPLGTAPPVAPAPVRDSPAPKSRVAAPRVPAGTRPPAPAMRPSGGVARPILPPREGVQARVAKTPAQDSKVDPPEARTSPTPVLAEAREAGPTQPRDTEAPAPDNVAADADASEAAAPSSDADPATPAPILPIAPKLKVPSGPGSAEDPFGLGTEDQAAAPEGAAKQAKSDARPAAPRPASIEPKSVGFYAAICVVLLLVAGIAVTAWKLRDRPEQVVAARTENASPEAKGKVVERADGEADGETSHDQQPAGDAATVPPPIPQSGQPATGAATDAQQAPAQTAPVQSTSATASIPVAQRAALLVDAPDDPQKVKTYVGNVVWRSESVSPGQDQPLSTAVRADVDIPDAKMTMSMVLKKNFEPQFPASHTLELHFAELPDNTLGPIKQINVPEMRKDDAAPTGDALTGVPVSITDDYFLVGLSRGGAEATNLQMLTDRNWIDVSVLLKSGKVAKITFEKGTSGQRILEDALKSWQ